MNELVTVVALHTFRYRHGVVSKGKRIDVTPEEATRLVHVRQRARLATPEEAATTPTSTPPPAPAPHPPTTPPAPSPRPPSDPAPPTPTAPVAESNAQATEADAIPVPAMTTDSPLVPEPVPSYATADLTVEETNEPGGDLDAAATTEGSPEPEARRRRRYRRRDLTAEA